MSDKRTQREDIDSHAAPRPTGKRHRKASSGGAVEGRVRRTALETTSDTTFEPTKNPFKLFYQFLTQIYDEMQKVVWPNRSEMVTYTIAVLIFLIFMTALVFGVDYGAGRAVEWIYTGSTS